MKCKYTVEIFRLGSKNTDTIDNIITDDAIASCCVDEYRGNRSSERGVNFSIGTNYQCSADDDSSEDSSHYSDCEFFKETVSRYASWEDNIWGKM